MNHPKYGKFYGNFKNRPFNDRETRQCLENTAENMLYLNV